MFILDKIITIKNLENKYNIIIYFNKYQITYFTVFSILK